MLAWSIYILIFSFFCWPSCFHWRNTFHTIVGVQQLGQIKNNNFSISQFSFLSKPRILFLQTGLILLREAKGFLSVFFFKIEQIYCNRFCNKKTSAAYISEWLICTFKLFDTFCHHGSSEFSLRVIVSVEVTYPPHFSTRDAIFQIFFSYYCTTLSLNSGSVQVQILLVACDG